MLFEKVMQILGVPGPDAGSSSGNTAIVAQRAIFVQGVAMSAARWRTATTTTAATPG